MVSDYYLIDLFNAYFNYQVKSYNLYKFFNPENNIRISDIKSEFKKFSEKYDVDFTNNQIPTMTTLKSLSSKSYKYWQVDRYDQKNSIFIEVELNTEKSQNAWVCTIGQTFMYIADNRFRHAIYIMFVLDRVIKRELSDDDKYLLDYLTQIRIYCYSVYQNDKNQPKTYTTIPKDLTYKR